jgi:5-methylcytosine-specific restriction endonuclease McrA
MKWKETENKPVPTHEKRKFYRKRVRKQFIKHLYACGELNCKEAAKGKLPEGLTIHHILPLSLSGDSKWDNLVVLDEKLHEAMNKQIFEPQIHQETIFIPLEFTELRSRLR